MGGVPVVSLIETSAFDAMMPVAYPAVKLSFSQPSRIVSVAPFAGQEKAASAALKAAHGLGFPAANRVVEKGDARIVWTGRGQAFLINSTPDGLDGIAALTDQSDGWSVFQLTGPGAVDVLARLVPLDLRPASFGKGACARAPLGHMMSVIVALKDGFEIMVMRSMTHTAVHELTAAMKAQDARAAG